MELKQVVLGTLLLLVSSTILVATGAVDAAGPVFGLSLSPLAVAAVARHRERPPR